MQTDAFRPGIGEAKWNCKVQVLHPESHFKCDLGRCDSGSGGPGTAGTQGDPTGIEVKSAAGGVPSLGDTLCAFSNLPGGGTIILGLDEARGSIPVGLGDIAGLEGAVASMARTSVTPPARCEFQTLTFEGALVLVAHVEDLPLAQCPARHGGIAYLRQSDGDYAMSEQEIGPDRIAENPGSPPHEPGPDPDP